MFANILDFLKNFSFETDFSFYSFFRTTIFLVINTIFLSLSTAINPNRFINKNFNEQRIPCNFVSSFTPIFGKLRVEDLIKSPDSLNISNKTLDFIQDYGYVSSSLTNAYATFYNLENKYDNFLFIQCLLLLYNIVVLCNIYTYTGFWFCVIYTLLSVAVIAFLWKADTIFIFLNSDDCDNHRRVVSYDEELCYKDLLSEKKSATYSVSREKEIYLELMRNRLFCINYSIKELNIRSRIRSVLVPVVIIFSFFLFVTTK